MGRERTRTVELLFDDEVVDTREVTLRADESTELAFVLPGEQTVEFEPNRSYTVTVDSGDDAEPTEKFVLEPSERPRGALVEWHGHTGDGWRAMGRTRRERG